MTNAEIGAMADLLYDGKTEARLDNHRHRSRPAGAVLVEPLDEWQASDRYDMSEACMATLFTAPTPLPTRPDEAPLPELAVA
jgi:hypothetical protein